MSNIDYEKKYSELVDKYSELVDKYSDLSEKYIKEVHEPSAPVFIYPQPPHEE